MGCFGCTKCGCYQDKDEITYYGAEQREQTNQTGFQSSDMPKRRINGSDYDNRQSNDKPQLLDGNKKGETLDLK